MMQRPGSRSESVAALVRELLTHMRSGVDPMLQIWNSPLELNDLVPPAFTAPGLKVGEAEAFLSLKPYRDSPIGATANDGERHHCLMFV